MRNGLAKLIIPFLVPNKLVKLTNVVTLRRRFKHISICEFDFVYADYVPKKTRKAGIIQIKLSYSTDKIVSAHIHGVSAKRQQKTDHQPECIPQDLVSTRLAKLNSIVLI